MFSFPTGTKMFQFPACVSISGYSCEYVFALGDLGFKGRMRLPQAYRSLPRPSSQSKPSYPSNNLLVDQTVNYSIIFLNSFIYIAINFGKLQLPPRFIEYDLSMISDRRSLTNSRLATMIDDVCVFIVTFTANKFAGEYDL